MTVRQNLGGLFEVVELADLDAMRKECRRHLFWAGPLRDRLILATRGENPCQEIAAALAAGIAQVAHCGRVNFLPCLVPAVAGWVAGELFDCVEAAYGRCLPESFKLGCLDHLEVHMHRLQQTLLAKEKI